MCMYIYLSIYLYIYICIYTYSYMYIYALNAAVQQHLVRTRRAQQILK